MFLVNNSLFAKDIQSNIKGLIKRSEVKIVINDNQINTNSEPIQLNGRILLPFRDILTNLGVENDDKHIIWEPKTKSVKVIKDKIEINLQIGKNQATVAASVYKGDLETVNEAVYKLDAPPMIYKDHTYIPIRFIAEALDKEVDWDELNKVVIINDQLNNENIRDILVNSLATMDKLKSFTSEEIILTNIKNKSNEKYNIKVTKRASADNKNRTYYSETESSAVAKIISKSYLTEKDLYYETGLGLEKKWTKREIGISFDSMRRYLINMRLFSDIIQNSYDSKLKLKHTSSVLSNKEQYIFTGSYFVEDLKKEALSLIPSYAKATANESKLNIYINKKTNILEKLELIIDYTIELEGEKFGASLSKSITYTDFDKELKVTIPEEAKAAALIK